MSSFKHWKMAGTVAALVTAGVLGVSLPGMAQKKNSAKTDSTIGFVDLGQVTEQIKRTSTWQQAAKRFDTERSKFQDEIAHLTKTRYLTSAERTELDNLRARKNVTDGEKTKIAELEAKSENLDKEFQNLAAREKPTEEEKKRINELVKLREEAISKIQEETDKRTNELHLMESKVLEEMQGKILEIVKQISDREDLAMVVDRQAILYGGRDLTPDVLTKLGAAPVKKP
jgi:Skp family chaperone for outer membrane proteins